MYVTDQGDFLNGVCEVCTEALIGLALPDLRTNISCEDRNHIRTNTIIGRATVN